MIECSSFGKENLSAETHFLFISLIFVRRTCISFNSYFFNWRMRRFQAQYRKRICFEHEEKPILYKQRFYDRVEFDGLFETKQNKSIKKI